jgi:ribosomal protein S15P/S13E
LNPERLLIATSRRALRLQGEHLFELGPLSVEQGALLLASKLCVGPPTGDEIEQLERAAAALEGNPQLLIELCQSLNARSEDTGWATSLQFLKLSQWLETSLLSWKGAFRASLEEDFACLGEEARRLLTHLAEHPQHFSGEELVTEGLFAGPARVVDLLQELQETSALQRLPEHRFVVPLPMRIYVRVKSADRAAANTRS